MRTDLLTPTEAAALVGLTPAGLRTAATRARRDRGIELLADRSLWPDQRTARYSRSALLRWRRSVPRRNRSAMPQSVASHLRFL